MIEIDWLERLIAAHIEAGAFENAEASLLEYRRALDRAVRSDPRESSGVEAILRHAHEFLEKTRRIALLRRSGLAAQLASLPHPVPYDRSGSRPMHSWSVEA